MQRRYRHIKLVATRVLECKEFSLATADLQYLQSEVTADTVVLMHHRRADFEFRKIANDGIGISHPRFAPSSLHRLFAEQLHFDDDGNGRFFHDQTIFQRCHGNAYRRGIIEERLPMIERHWMYIVMAEQLLQRFPPSGAFRGKQHAAFKIFKKMF